MTDPTTAFAAAKINLCLHVTGRCDTGYHLLDSLVAFAGIGDRLTLAPGRDITLSIEGEHAADLTDESDNIILKAARLLAPLRSSSAPHGASLTLTKILPVASGIGGGSADAAAAVRLLCSFWKISLPQQQLMEIALSLGADVPVCLHSRPVRLRGVGDVLDPLPPLPPSWLVLANPRVQVSTATVFSRRKGEPFSAAVDPIPEWPDTAALARFLRTCRNDLSTAAISIAPCIATVLDALERQNDCLFARMSGSGATCFGLFERREQAEKAASTLARHHPGWWVTPAPLLRD